MYLTICDHMHRSCYSDESYFPARCNEYLEQATTETNQAAHCSHQVVFKLGISFFCILLYVANAEIGWSVFLVELMIFTRASFLAQKNQSYAVIFFLNSIHLRYPLLSRPISRALRERSAVREIKRGHAFSEMQYIEHDFEAVEVRVLAKGNVQ